VAMRLRAPGFYRAGLFIVLGIAFSYALSIGLRALFGFDPLLDGESVLQIALIATPLFFLVGIGAFDYWFYWAAGKPTRPEDHSGHGAKSWRDYFRVNTDHKVIGIQYIVTSFFFMFVGGLLAMVMRAELAQPGLQFVDTSTFNGPFIAASQFLALLDYALHFHFFDADQGGNVLSYQHIFWFYSHPAVYIMMLPGFGIVSEVISTHARKPIFGYRLMALALIGIVVLSYTVWAHHMFVSGMFAWLRVPMMITTLLIAVPTGIKIFSWLGTLFGSVLHLRSTAMLFALGFIVTFTIGGISGVMLGMVPIDIHVSDTYFVVAHIHFVLFGGSVFTIFAGIFHFDEIPRVVGGPYEFGVPGARHAIMAGEGAEVRAPEPTVAGAR